MNAIMTKFDIETAEHRAPKVAKSVGQVAGSTSPRSCASTELTFACTR